MINRSLFVIFPPLITFLVFGSVVSAQFVDIDVSKLLIRPEIYFSPRTGSFVEGTTFDIPILLNTRGASVNGLEVRVSFDSSRLEIVRPTGGESVIGVWVEPPRFDNSKGTASYVGVITNGITTGSGLIGTITFKSKRTGRASIVIDASSKVFLNNGLGSEMNAELGRADYTILVKPPEGVRIFSETHPSQGEWYNNNSPSISWEKDQGVEGFSFILDNKPSTIPENKVLTSETNKGFENLEDGLWYFHIKATKNGVWGTTGHFLVRIDTKPPAEFRPQLNYITASTALIDRALVSFFTTDNLSGIGRYEIGIIDKAESTSVSPVFVEAESPFQVPLSGSGNLIVIVRAIDMAGNTRDLSLNVESPSLLKNFIKNNIIYVILLFASVLITGFVVNYLVGHHIIRHIKRAIEFIKKDEMMDKQSSNEGNK